MGTNKCSRIFSSLIRKQKARLILNASRRCTETYAREKCFSAKNQSIRSNKRTILLNCRSIQRNRALQVFISWRSRRKMMVMGLLWATRSSGTWSYSIRVTKSRGKIRSNLAMKSRRNLRPNPSSNLARGSLNRSKNHNYKNN